MLAATGGINTHRGAVFMLGLLCAAGGAVAVEGRPLQAHRVRATLTDRWGAALAARARQVSSLPGGIAVKRHGLRGAAAEAADGFPTLFETAAPALARALARGLPRDHALLDTLFHVMAVLDDSNLAHRGGLDGLRSAQSMARAFLDRGGAGAADGLQQAKRIGDRFVEANLSPGGSADTLAAACWLHRVGLLGPAAAK
jgi:triphosphoribosyl-dephospho-CoA synthase